MKRPDWVNREQNPISIEVPQELITGIKTRIRILPDCIIDIEALGTLRYQVTQRDPNKRLVRKVVFYTTPDKVICNIVGYQVDIAGEDPTSSEISSALQRALEEMLSLHQS